MNTIYDSLDAALDALRLSVTELGNNVASLRADIMNNGVDPLEANKRYLCDQINASRFAYKEPNEIPESWGVTALSTKKELDVLAADYIEYRYDKASGRL